MKIVSEYASLFDVGELATLEKVAREPVAVLHDTIAMHYCTNNNNTLFVTEPSVMDAVRAARRSGPADIVQ